MEAWDTVSILEDGAPGLSAGGDIDPLLLVAHRLRGAAALHGFPRLAEQAAAIESMLEGAASAGDSERAAIGAALGEAVIQLREGLEGVGGSQLEPAAPAEEPAPVAASQGGLVEELAGFFAANADVLEYFGPEAAEHLDTITHSLLAIESGADRDVEAGTLFRAFHTLKGAAFTVGCRAIGDFAHRVEDLLVAIREGRRPFAPAAVEAMLRERRRHPAHAGRFRASARPRGRGGTRDGPARPRSCARRPPRSRKPPPSTPPSSRSSRPRPEAARRPSPPGRPRGASRISIRVAVDRLDSLMNLVGELVVARSRMDEHLGQLDRVGELLLWSRSRMAQAVRTFEGKYEYTALPALSGARAGGGSGAPPAAAACIPGRRLRPRLRGARVRPLRRLQHPLAACRRGLRRRGRGPQSARRARARRPRGRGAGAAADVGAPRRDHALPAGADRHPLRAIGSPGPGRRPGGRQVGGSPARGRRASSSTTPSSSRSPTPCCTSCRTRCSMASSPRPNGGPPASPPTAPCTCAPIRRAARCSSRWRTTAAASTPIASGPARSGAASSTRSRRRSSASARPSTSCSCLDSAPRRSPPRWPAGVSAWTSCAPTCSGSAARSTSRPRWAWAPASPSSCRSPCSSAMPSASGSATPSWRCR